MPAAAWKNALLSPDAFKRRSADKNILIPKRQIPLPVNRVVYFKGPLVLDIYTS